MARTRTADATPRRPPDRTPHRAGPEDPSRISTLDPYVRRSQLGHREGTPLTSTPSAPLHQPFTPV
jgi:hypothetical protein